MLKFTKNGFESDEPVKVNIYQMVLNEQTHGKIFEDIRAFDKEGVTAVYLDRNLYERTFSGTLPVNDIEDIFTRFNINHPEGYRGRSLSVSDVVGIEDGDEERFFFIRSIGAHRVYWAPPKPEDVKRYQLKEFMDKLWDDIRAAGDDKGVADIVDYASFGDFHDDPVIYTDNFELWFCPNFGCEGIYLDIILKGHITNDTGDDIRSYKAGTIKTLLDSKGAMASMAALGGYFNFYRDKLVTDECYSFMTDEELKKQREYALSIAKE